MTETSTHPAFDPSLGVRRRLWGCSDADGRFTMLAIDHRQNLVRALGPGATDDDLIDFKLDVISSLGPASSSLLVDPEFGAAQAITTGALAGARGMVVAVEATGYVNDPAGRLSRVLEGWSVEQAARLGADAVKLLVYYHPEAANAAHQEALVSEVAERCRSLDLPLFLEPLSFSVSGTPLGKGEFTDIVIETAGRLTPLGGDVLKAEFPSKMEDPAEWMVPLRRLDAASTIPWVILSGGVPFEVFRDQAETAAGAGACGVMVGRAVWNEAIGLTGAERLSFLTTTARERLERLAAVTGPGWQERATPIQRPSGTWYR